MLIQGVLGAFCGRLAAARAAFIDLEPSSAPCGSLGSILLGTLAPSGELLRVLWESREQKWMLFYGNMMVFVFSMILHSSLFRAIGMVLGELLCCLAAIGGPLGDSWEVLGDPWGLPLVVLRALLGNLLAVPWRIWSSLD